MKKIMNWMLAAILVCGTSVFTSCSTSDDPVTPPADNKKCSRFEVVYRITNPKDNNTFFEGKYALMSNGQVKEINKLMPFAEQQNAGYNVNEIAAFPAEEAICLHYFIKDLESYEGDHQLIYQISYTVTTFNAKGDQLDTQTINDQYTERGSTHEKKDIELSIKLSYTELHASVAEDGRITLSKVNKMHPERSGIEW